MIYPKVKELTAKRERDSGQRITQNVLAEAVGVRRPTISRWFSPDGMKYIDADLLYRFCEYFGVGIEDVIEVRKS